MFSKILLLLCLAATLSAQLCYGIDASNSTVCSSQGACLSTNATANVCSCYSGYAGNNCAQVAPTSTCTWNNNTQSNVGFYPTLDTPNMAFTNNMLYLSFKAPLVNGRLNSTVYIQSKSYTQCAYPGNYTTNTLDLSTPCYNRFNYSIPWDVAVNCGWDVVVGTDQDVYSANVFVESLEVIGAIRGYPVYRSVQTMVPISITFKKRLFISAIITVESHAALYTAILVKKYIPGPPVSGDFDFLTSLQYPYMMNTSAPFSVVSVPTGLTASISDISIAGECPSGAPCVQKWRIPVGVTTACTFTGTYTINFKLQCHPSIVDPVNCPLDSTNNNAVATLTVDSENFCVTAGINVGLIGTLKSYSDNAFTVQKSAYSHGNTAYFRASLASSQAFLTGCKIISVQWEDETSLVTQTLYSNSFITTEGINEVFALGPNDTSTASFNFKLDPSWMPVPVDGSRNFNVSAIVEVSYAKPGMQGDFSSNMKMNFAASDLAPAIAYDGNQPDKKVVQIGLARNDFTSHATKKTFGMIVIVAGILLAIVLQ
jgi:hypothetical protein